MAYPALKSCKLLIVFKNIGIVLNRGHYGDFLHYQLIIIFRPLKTSDFSHNRQTYD
jgi:hypothetical protein